MPQTYGLVHWTNVLLFCQPHRGAPLYDVCHMNFGFAFTAINMMTTFAIFFDNTVSGWAPLPRSSISISNASSNFYALFVTSKWLWFNRHLCVLLKTFCMSLCLAMPFGISNVFRISSNLKRRAFIISKTIFVFRFDPLHHRVCISVRVCVCRIQSKAKQNNTSFKFTYRT